MGHRVRNKNIQRGIGLKAHITKHHTAIVNTAGHRNQQVRLHLMTVFLTHFTTIVKLLLDKARPRQEHLHELQKHLSCKNKEWIKGHFLDQDKPESESRHFQTKLHLYSQFQSCWKHHISPQRKQHWNKKLIFYFYFFINTMPVFFFQGISELHHGFYGSKWRLAMAALDFSLHPVVP